MMSDSNSRLVYSTETGRIDEPKAAPVRPKGDGVVRIQRQTSGRKGKGVCLITGVDLDDAELTKLAAELKKKCGCGGAVKDGVIEIKEETSIFNNHLDEILYFFQVTKYNVVIIEDLELLKSRAISVIY